MTLRGGEAGPKLAAWMGPPAEATMAQSSTIAKVLLAGLRVYQLTLSRLLVALFGPACRFEPSCSRYAVACIRDHGALRGTLLSVKRLCRCHPFHPGGFDPPPAPHPRGDQNLSDRTMIDIDPPR